MKENLVIGIEECENARLNVYIIKLKVEYFFRPNIL